MTTLVPKYDLGETGAVNRPFNEKLAEIVSAKDFGAVGDGVVNDTAALQAMFATNKPWFIPYTSGGYLVNGILAPKASGVCEGFLLADTGYAGLVVNIEGLGYQPNTKITGLVVNCKSARTADSVGIRVNSPSVVLDRCKVSAFDYGIQVWSYSVALMNCNANLCKTNLSAYAPSSSSEINDFKVIGGNYDSATEYSCRIGDPRFATTVPVGGLMGFSVLVIGAAFDGATSTFDRVASLTIQSCYWEGPINSKAIELGGVGNNVIRTVDIRGCYFANVAYPIYCNNAIQALTVGPNYYGVSGTQAICALYAVQVDVSPVTYFSGASTLGFLGPEVHTGFTDTTVSQLTFGNMTIGDDYLIEGVQLAPIVASTTNWYPNGKTLAGQTQLASATGRFKTNPSTAIAGTFSGFTFTCTTLADARAFNGGDRITTSAGGSTFVRFVDYVTGIITLGGGAAAAGAGTISQDTIYFRTVSINGSAAPVAGTYNQGDIVYNSAPTAGGTIGFVCVTAGTPGTWKTFGAITP
jgi:hypothetical protein